MHQDQITEYHFSNVTKPQILCVYVQICTVYVCVYTHTHPMILLGVLRSAPTEACISLGGGRNGKSWYLADKSQEKIKCVFVSVCVCVCWQIIIIIIVYIITTRVSFTHHQCLQTKKSCFRQLNKHWISQSIYIKHLQNTFDV